MALSPGEDELGAAVEELRGAHPSLGAVKLLIQLRADHPEWAVSEKRLRKMLQARSEVGLIAHTGLDPSLDVSIAPKVKVEMFGGGKGKGLVAREGILKGELVWQEDPWIVTADP